MFENPQDYIPENAPKEIKKKMFVVTEQQRFEDESVKPPSKFYILDAFNNAVYFKTRSRAKAQEMSDVVYGQRFFQVKEVVIAITR